MQVRANQKQAGHKCSNLEPLCRGRYVAWLSTFSWAVINGEKISRIIVISLFMIQVPHWILICPKGIEENRQSK